MRNLLGTLAVVALLLAVSLPAAGALLPLPGAAGDLPMASEWIPGVDEPVAPVVLSEQALRQAASGEASAAAGTTGVADAYLGFASGLVGEAPTSAADLAGRAASLMGSFGYGTAASAAGPGIFEDRNVLTYTYTLGDVNVDGNDDVALEQFCNQSYGCLASYISLGPDTANWILTGDICGAPHRLAAVDGITGQEIWSRPLDEQHRIREPTPAYPSYGGACAQEFVVGLVPLDEGRSAPLVYRYEIFGVGPFTFEHEYYLLDPIDGKMLWSYPPRSSPDAYGYLDPNLGIAQNIILLPIFQAAPSANRRLNLGPIETSLIVQSVGFVATGLSARQTLPGMDSPIMFLDSYQPREWAARVNLQTGIEAWNVPTFQPDPLRSVVPHALAGPNPLDLGNSGRYSMPARKAYWFWDGDSCCYDLNGDTIPDLVYWTHEWASTPAAKAVEVYDVASRLVAFSGKDGAPLYDQVLVQDSPNEHADCSDPRLFNPPKPYCLAVWPQALGDVDGDGLADFAVHLEYFTYDYSHSLSIRSGADGRELWAQQSRRNLELVVLGDADGDGGNDYAYFEFHNERYAHQDETFGYDVANVTAIPIIVRRGVDGRELHRAVTFTAPSDLQLLFGTIRVNGVPDIDQNGVGDLIVDDPIYYPDLTVVHRHTWLSGNDGASIGSFNAVGGFSFPGAAGDLTADGRDDFVLINGDINDLWVTAYDAADGQPLWSRRISSLRNSNYVTASAYIRTHTLHLSDAAPSDSVLINLHFELFTIGGYIGTESNLPQLAAYRGLNGSADWALPDFEAADFSIVHPGASPLTAEFNRAYSMPDATPLSAASYAAPLRAALGAGLFAAFAAVGFGATAAWRRFL